MKDIAKELETEIARGVSLIFEASRRAAQAALDSAFAQPSKNVGLGKREIRRASSHSARPPTQRRSAADMEVLTTAFMQEIWATPGETMTALSLRMGVEPYSLKVPVRSLKAQGKLRTVGRNQFTRYFPVEPANGGVQETL